MEKAHKLGSHIPRVTFPADCVLRTDVAGLCEARMAWEMSPTSGRGKKGGFQGLLCFGDSVVCVLECNQGDVLFEGWTQTRRAADRDVL